MSLFSWLFNSQPVNQMDAAQLKSRQGQVFLLDVRQPEEFREGHIAGARLIPLGDLEKRLKDLPGNREIVCVCRSGNRSGTAARKLAAAGYKVSNLRGGMIAWARAGLPVKRGGG